MNICYINQSTYVKKKTVQWLCKHIMFYVLGFKLKKTRAQNLLVFREFNQNLNLGQVWLRGK
jgi:hypothetical protein